MRVNETFAVLTCDIIRSRKFDYPKLLNVVNENILRLKKRFGNIFYAGPELVFGDSIQMVIVEPGLSLNVFNEFEEYLWLAGKESLGEPIKIRCGIGIGSIVGGKDKIGEMAGEAFIRARDALNSIKRVNRHSFVSVVLSEKFESEWLSAVVGVATALKSHWTFAQRKAILAYRESDSMQKAGDVLKKPRQEISELLKRANFREFYQLEIAIKKVIR